MSNGNDLYYIHLFNDFSGSPRVLSDAINCEVNSRGNTYVFTSRHNGFLDKVKAKKVSCFYARSSNRYVQFIIFSISQLLLFFQLVWYLIVGFTQGRKSTVVINTMLPFGAGLAAKLMRAKAVYYIHETYISPITFKKFLRFFIEHCSDNVIFVSKYLASVESFKRPIQTVLYNGLRSDFPQNISVDKRLKFNNKEILFVGSLRLYKGVNELFSLSQLLPDFNFILALNCDRRELDCFLKGRVIPENMSIVVRPKKLSSYYSSSFIVLNLTLVDTVVETFGLSLMEGMAFGSPVIGPPVGGPTEFIDVKSGLLIDSLKIEEIATFINYLDSSFSIWCSYSDSAFKVSKKFTFTEYKNNFRKYVDEKELLFKEN